MIASHSNARALCCPLPEMARTLGAESLAERNLSDDLIRRLADKGGVACVNFAPARHAVEPFAWRAGEEK